MPGPLDGLVVVDRTWGLPGAIAGMLFADYGATVIKIERPGGGPDRGSVLRRILDRGKCSIELDRGDPAHGDTVGAPPAGAAVVLARAPPAGDLPTRLVHCTITGFGLDGPLRDRPAYAPLVASRFGITAEQGGHRKGPIFLGHPAIDYCTALLTVMGALAALHVRHQTGRGQHVDTSLLDGALAASSMNWWWNERDLSYLARTGDEPGFGRNRLITDLFQCADGEYLMVHTGGEGGFKRTMDI